MMMISKEQFLREVQSIIPKDPKCMEIGVYNGDNAENIFRLLNPSRLVLIDPFDNGIDPITNFEYYPKCSHQKTVYSDENCLNYVKNRLSYGIQSGIVEIERGYSTDVIQKFEDNEFDFIYIDACHIYESVLWDLENYITKVKPGGMIAGHDYGSTAYGVTEAVNDFCEKHNYEIIMLSTDQDFALSLKK